VDEHLSAAQEERSPKTDEHFVARGERSESEGERSAAPRQPDCSLPRPGASRWPYRLSPSFAQFSSMRCRPA